MADGPLDFQSMQYAFAAHLRDPGRHPPLPDVDPARLRLYRELLFNNIESFVAAGFPVLKSILTRAQWLALVQDFFASHHSKTPLFVEIAEEFLSYLHDERGERSDDPAFLLELAHYEWVELALAVSEAEPLRSDEAFLQNPLSGMIRLSELAWPLAYRFPVHRIGPSYQPAEPPDPPTFLVVYRDPDDAVRFLEINPATYRLLQLLEEGGPLPARECLLRTADALYHPDPASLLGFGADILRELAERGVIGADILSDPFI